MACQTSLRDIVRERTAAAHVALEATPLMLAMAGGAPAAEDYRAYLVGQWSMHAPLESALRRWVTPAWRDSRLVKTGWLADDLQVLGGLADPVPEPALRITCEAEAMGVLYVLEGGTLGLQVVRKRLRPDLATGPDATRFLRGYGADTARQWRDFIARLDALPEGDHGRAADAACATFSAFQRRFARPQP